MTSSDALDYEFCDSMKAWTIWDTTAQSCSAKSSSTEAKRDMSVGNQATRCATACESDTCEQNRPAVLGRENGETTTLAVVQWDASEATTTAYVEKTTTSFVQNRASAKPSIKEALGLVPIAKSGMLSYTTLWVNSHCLRLPIASQRKIEDPQGTEGTEPFDCEEETGAHRTGVQVSAWNATSCDTRAFAAALAS